MFIKLLTIVLIGNTAAWTDNLNFDSCSTYTIHNVNDDQSFSIDWDGDSIDVYSCKIGFHGYDDEHILNKYKVCIQATYWDIQNNEVQLKYYTGISDFLQRSYSENSGYNPTVEWCSEPDDYVDIELDTANDENYQGRITLQVRAVKTYDYYGTMGWAVGGTIGGIFVLVVFITIIIIACRRTPASRNRTSYETVNTPNTIITQSGSQQMGGGYANPGYFVGPAPPSYFDVTKNAYIQVPVHNYQQPPSYQQYSQQTAGNTQQTTGNVQQTAGSTQEAPGNTQSTASEQITQNESTKST